MAQASLFGNKTTAANPFSALMPSSFPPGTNQTVVKCFQMADQDQNGFIDDKELKKVLSSCNHTFSIRTVRLLMYVFTNTNTRKIGPREFSQVYYGLQSWRGLFENYDKNRNGKIDSCGLGEALQNLGFNVSPLVLNSLVSKFDQGGGTTKAIDYDSFIQCCLTVKGLAEKFKQRENACNGSATFNYENFLLSVLPFVAA